MRLIDRLKCLDGLKGQIFRKMKPWMNAEVKKKKFEDKKKKKKKRRKRQKKSS